MKKTAKKAVKLPVASCFSKTGSCVNHGACNAADRCAYAPSKKSKKK